MTTEKTPSTAEPSAEYHANVGDGAAAQGEGAVAVGRGGVFVRGDNAGNINVTIHEGKGAVSIPFQAPPPARDQVPRPHYVGCLKDHLLTATGELLPNTIGLHGFGGVGKTTWRGNSVPTQLYVLRARMAFFGSRLAKLRPIRARRLRTSS
jgi:hypothetical protein